MGKFKGYMLDEADRETHRYVAVQYDQATQKKLREWALENGFDLTVDFDGTEQSFNQFDFHTTIFFTTTKHTSPRFGLYDVVVPNTARVTGYEILGKERQIPTLRVESDGILKLRKYFEKEGYNDEWPEYKPHITVSYAQTFPDMSKIKLPDFELTFDKYKIQEAKQIV